MNIHTILYSVLIVILTGCNNNGRSNVTLKRPSGKEIAELNTYFVEKDRERIISYAERKNLVLKETGSGLWYLIRNAGNGVLLKDKDHVTIKYRCSLLDGTLCYSSDTLGQKEIVLGRSELEAGLNEGLRMLGHGGEALFILPPFLGYGLLGDNKSIPPRATLVYEIRITN